VFVPPAILQVLPLRSHGVVWNWHRRFMFTVRDII